MGSEKLERYRTESSDDAALLRRRDHSRVLFHEAGRRQFVQKIENSQERRPRGRLVRPAVPDQIHDLLVPTSW